ncbi:FkbM family methyltransferase [Candidatus Atribacteria bacterium 1244-E10-H5-B2]|nr:MAG: FkbM family methyltransferase [Candidatus Atribacteria bacterium 1244-E10-H5-B2]
MNKINFLKKISYYPFIIRIIRFFHLQPILRKWYYHFSHSKDGILKLEISGIKTRFYVYTPEELRLLESIGEERILELLILDLQPSDVVYDIGGNIGFYTIFLAKKISNQGEVFVFEPEKESYIHLQNNIKLNNLTNVCAFQKAVGDRSGEAKLYLGQTTGNFSLVKTYEKETGCQIVEIVNGDQFVKEKNLPIPKVVKIDVEGYEYSVLQGLRQTLSHLDCEIICCEVHPHLLPPDVNGEKILELITSLGFRQFDTYKRVNDYHIIAYKNKKLKVLVSAYSCLSESGVKSIGGEAILGWNIVKQLSCFHQVYVFTHTDNCLSIENALQKESLPNAKFYYLNLHRFLNFLQKFQGGIQLYTYLWQIRAYFFARKLHQKFHFNIFHHVTYANDWMASFIGALLKILYVRGPGGGAHRVPKSFLSEFSSSDRLSQYLRSIGQWFFRRDPFFILGQKRAKAILICNRESLEKIPKKWQNKTYLFPVNGISTEDLDLLSLKEKSNDKFRILSAGKLLKIKGFSLSIKAFKIFSDKVSDTEFTIIGDGTEFSHLQSLVSKLKIQKKVQFKKWIPREEFLKKLTDCDVFLFLSLRDGGGQVIVEAMAAGKPVICLDIAGPGFHISNEWGIKIKPYSPEQAIQDIANALERLYKDRKLRYQMGRAARKRAEEVYHWDRLGDNFLKIYQEVLKL